MVRRLSSPDACKLLSEEVNLSSTIEEVWRPASLSLIWLHLQHQFPHEIIEEHGRGCNDSSQLFPHVLVKRLSCILFAHFFPGYPFFAHFWPVQWLYLYLAQLRTWESHFHRESEYLERFTAKT